MKRMLLGAHSIGSARPDHQGYSGRWVPQSENVLSNSFYQTILGHKWYHTAISPVTPGAAPAHQYATRDFPNSLMLYSDVSMGWQQDTNDFGCNVTGSATGCPPTKNLGLLRQFAQDNNYFLSKFSDAWWKLANFGGNKLSSNGQGCTYTFTRRPCSSYTNSGG